MLLTSEVLDQMAMILETTQDVGLYRSLHGLTQLLLKHDWHKDNWAEIQQVMLGINDTASLITSGEIQTLFLTISSEYKRRYKDLLEQKYKLLIRGSTITYRPLPDGYIRISAIIDGEGKEKILEAIHDKCSGEQFATILAEINADPV